MLTLTHRFSETGSVWCLEMRATKRYSGVCCSLKPPVVVHNDNNKKRNSMPEHEPSVGDRRNPVVVVIVGPLLWSSVYEGPLLQDCEQVEHTDGPPDLTSDCCVTPSVKLM